MFKDFFNRSSVKVAPDILGYLLCRRVGNKTYKLRITETEAYEGLEDLASHASRGRTKRNEPMFGEGGTIYIYFIYGMYYMLNIVCGPKDHPSAVLIRGVEGMKGPGILTRELKIGKSLNGKKLGRSTGLWIEKTRLKSNEKIKIKRSPRVGVNYAGPIWSKKLYRFTSY
jgi:DNA-3-methyladenine glycosylase